MANEKEKASQAIVEAIEREASQLIQHDHDAERARLNASLEKYHDDVRASFALQYDTLKDRFEQSKKSEASTQRFHTMQALLEYRETLMQAFKTEMIDKLNAFRKTQAYPIYLNEAISCVSEEIMSMSVLNADAHLIKGENVHYRDAGLGGIRIETKHRIYDYTFETRLEKALLELQKDSRLQLKGGHDE